MVHQKKSWYISTALDYMTEGVFKTRVAGTNCCHHDDKHSTVMLNVLFWFYFYCMVRHINVVFIMRCIFICYMNKVWFDSNVFASQCCVSTCQSVKYVAMMLQLKNKGSQVWRRKKIKIIKTAKRFNKHELQHTCGLGLFLSPNKAFLNWTESETREPLREVLSPNFCIFIFYFLL